MRRVLLAVLACSFVSTFVYAQNPPQQSQAAQSAQAPQAAQAPRLPASPRGVAATQVGGKWVPPGPDANPGAAPRYTDGKWITIEYGRPILRGRSDIFGSSADYGQKVNDGAPVWRAGANQTTRLRTEVPLVLGGRTLPAGEYSMFVDLKPDQWTLILSNQPFQQKYDPNNKTETWGSTNYDAKFDLLRVPMKMSKGNWSVDQFTIQFVDMTADGGTLALLWDREVATVPFKAGS
jgi:hypothetical protein